MAIYKLRVVEKTEDGGMIRLSCEDEDAAVYSVTVTGGTGGADPTIADELKLNGPTWLEVIDAPVIAGGDDAPGLLFAGGSVLDQWPGAVILRSTDGGVTFTEIGTISQRAIVGSTDDALAPWYGGHMLDNCSSVTVRVHGGTLSSCTYAQLLEGANACIIGGEPLQFMTATLVSAGRYALTGFLRHGGGTERLTNTHLPGDRFVMLDPATILRIEGDYRGREAIYRAVTKGAPITAGTDFTITETQAQLLPLSPVNLHVSALATGGYRAQWTRRTRAAAPWVDGVDAPIGETVEAYRLRVLWGSAELLSVTVNEGTTYDFGVGEDYTYHDIEVSQISTRVGPGWPAITTP